MWIMAVFLSCFLFLPSINESQLQEANQTYLEGIQASTLTKRKLLFNQALVLYTGLEKQGPPSSALLQRIGDLYDHLENDPWALLYYQRAFKLEGYYGQAHQKAAYIQKRLNLQSEGPATQSWALFWNWLPRPLLWTLFAILGVISLLCFSLDIGLSLLFFRRIGWGAATASLALLIAITFSFYALPLEAIIISPSNIYRQPHFNQALLSPNPLLPGRQVQVLDVLQEGTWIKTRLEDGTLGFIPFTSLRII